MKMQLSGAFGITFVSLFVVPGAMAQTWAPTAAPVAEWEGIACSADGVKVIAAEYMSDTSHNPGWLYLSSDSGVSWQQAAAPRQFWERVVCSSDGTHLAAAAYADANWNPGGIYVSSDSGLTWTPSTAPRENWIGLASSGDGRILFAVAWYGTIYASSDFGASWQSTSAPVQYWHGIACSVDGTQLVAAGYGDSNMNPERLWVSQNSGQNWTATTSPNDRWYAVACSVDGKRLFAATASGLIYTSSDSGATWESRSAPDQPWSAIACSKDGGKAIAAGSSFSTGTISVSDNAGKDWQLVNATGYWTSLASSANGDIVFAAEGGIAPGGISRWQAPPVLAINSTPGRITLSWPANAPRFVLQHSLDAAGTSWTDVAIPANTNGMQTQVSFSPTAGSHFYRLRSQ